jgi:peptidoglycan hydrolase-like protein with peptidoglycan-binding domain
VYGAKTDAAIREFEHAAGLKASVDPDEALLRAITHSAVLAPPVPTPATSANAKRVNATSAAAPSKRVVAVQRALADFGYGQLAPSGVADPATKTAIERFERERKLPVTGQVSDRVVRELAAMTGRPLE